MNTVAMTCMMAVPSMLMVMPSGRTKEAMLSSTPNSSSHTLMFRGRVAALEEVEKPNTATLAIFRMKVKGFSLAPSAMTSG